MSAISDPHHDPSPLHLSDSAPSLGHTVTLRVRVPHGSGVERVHVRCVHDGEPRFTEAVVDHDDAWDRWWRADVAVHNPVLRYRFLLTGPQRHSWLTGLGCAGHDVSDAFDFTVSTFMPPPSWLADTVAYQVFPDRFASSGAARDWPAWAVRSRWDHPVDADWRVSTRQLFGGDLPGAQQRLDHVAGLGANLVYLTPVFPARSSHRYDATTFDHVDPLLGGDEALASFVRAARARGMRVVCDLTTNHSGDHHDWFRAARTDPTGEEAGYYLFGESPDEYEAWLGVPTLPKFDHRSVALRRRLLEGADSVVGRYLAGATGIDGWRIDVANMTGRLGVTDVNHDVARAIRATMADVRPDAWLVAEHCYDAADDLRGDGWHGTMAYAAFTRPVWTWLQDAAGPARGLMGLPVPLPRLPGTAVHASMRELSGRTPWRATTANLVLLGSHDTARFATVVGSRERHVVGVAMLCTTPGVPMVFAGDEVGVQGHSSDDGRRPFPWDTAAWDHTLLTAYRRLVALRRSEPALRHGGLRWVHVGDDVLVYLREAPEGRVLVQVSRDAHPPVRLPAAAFGDLSRCEPLLDHPVLTAVDGAVNLAADGPTARLWRLAW